MTSVSLSISRGVSGTRISDLTVGSSAPGALDVEVRYNNVDSNFVNLTREDVFLALQAFRRAIEEGGTQVNIIVVPPR